MSSLFSNVMQFSSLKTRDNILEPHNFAFTELFSGEKLRLINYDRLLFRKSVGQSSKQET
jgi:hypothetical protein